MFDPSDPDSDFNEHDDCKPPNFFQIHHGFKTSYFKSVSGERSSPTPTAMITKAISRAEPELAGAPQRRPQAHLHQRHRAHRARPRLLQSRQRHMTTSSLEVAQLGPSRRHFSLKRASMWYAAKLLHSLVTTSVKACLRLSSHSSA